MAFLKTEVGLQMRNTRAVGVIQIVLIRLM
jgi:hypothetical protein